MPVWSDKNYFIIKLTASLNLVSTSFLVHTSRIDGVILHVFANFWNFFWVFFYNWTKKNLLKIFLQTFKTIWKNEKKIFAENRLVDTLSMLPYEVSRHFGLLNIFDIFIVLFFRRKLTNLENLNLESLYFDPVNVLG